MSTDHDIKKQTADLLALLRKNELQYPTLKQSPRESNPVENNKLLKARILLRNGASPSLSTLQHIATASGVTVFEFFTKNPNELRKDIDFLIKQYDVSENTPSVLPCIVSEKRFGTRMARELQKKDLSQKDVSRQLEVSIPAVNHWGSGRNNPSAIRTYLLAQTVLEITILELIVPDDELPGTIAGIARRHNIPLLPH
jgi:transcriptional regulator with XRE-family HTH domain